MASSSRKIVVSAAVILLTITAFSVSVLTSADDSQAEGTHVQDAIVYTIYSCGANVTGYESGVTEVKIPENLTINGKVYYPSTIEKGAFEGCTSLISLDAPFIDEIGEGAFKGCSALTEANLPELYYVMDIFEGCTSLKTVNIAKAVGVHNNAFKDLNIESVNTPAVKKISPDAFSGCNSLARAHMPAVTELGLNSFKGCVSLVSVDIPMAETIRYNAFLDCANLVFINMPKITDLSLGAFSGCSSLVFLEVGQSNVKYKSINGALYTEGGKVLSICLQGKAGLLTIPSGVEKIADDAFRGCNQLEYVFMPPSLTKVGINAFSGCAKLKYVSMPGVTAIDREAFMDCVSLTSVEMPSITSFGLLAFSGCTSLTQVTFQPGFSERVVSVFDGCTSLKTVVFQGDCKIEPYLSFANWKFDGNALDTIVFDTEKIPSGIDESLCVSGKGIVLARDDIDITLSTVGDSVHGVGPAAYYSDGTTWLTARKLVPVPIAQSAVYNGHQHTAVSASQDYSVVTNGTATAAGVYGAAVKLKDDKDTWADGIKGSRTLFWVIGPSNVAGLEITVDDVTYDDSEAVPPVTVKAQGKTLDPTDYYLFYHNNGGVGTAKVFIVLKGNYEGFASQTFEINAPATDAAGNSDDSTILLVAVAIVICFAGIIAYLVFIRGKN